MTTDPPSEKHAANIDGHDAIEILFGELDDRTHRSLDACIVDEAVDFPPEFEGAGGVAEYLFRIAHVGHEGLERAGAGHLRDKACQSGFVGSDGQDICALRDQALGDGGAKVACGASNDDILA